MKNKIKVGITTWVGNLSLNYGSILQAAAMQKLIQDCGCNPITIDFYHYHSMPKPKGKKRIILFFKQLYRYGINYLTTKRSFQRFMHKYMNVSRSISDNKKLVNFAKKNLHILLCGSDAIWVKEWLFAQPHFLWDYEELKEFPKIAYAPSVPAGELFYPNMRQALGGFVAISGRETIMKDLLLPYTDQEVSIVLDPTLAVEKDFWNDKCLKPLIQEPYIIGYFLSYASLHRLSIEKIKQRYHVNKIVYINTNFVDIYVDGNLTDYKGEDYKKTVGPREFLSLIKDSVAVCTDSYHGVALSIVFKRDFYVFDRPMIQEYRENYRLPDLFLRLGIEDRWVETNRCIDEMKNIDWDTVDNRLQEERKRSIAFLRNAIKKSIEKRGTINEYQGSN